MRFLLVALLLASITLGGCYTMRTYTFKKDRVDQEVEGNRGYIMGTPPPAPAMKRVPKRTFIGVDIETGLLPGENAKVEFGEPLTAEQETLAGETGKRTKAIVEEEKIEERWIK